MTPCARATVCTVIARNYTAHARVLARSLRVHGGGVPFAVLLIDEPGPPFDPKAEEFPIVRLEDLGLPCLRETCFRLDCRELASLVKPFLLEHLLDQGFETVLFLDPDVLVVGALAPVVERVRAHPVTLTPHVLAPLDSARGAARELTIVLSGTFNAGFVAVTRSDAAVQFLRWWQDRTMGACAHRTADGVFYDQRWLDLAPGLFGGVEIVRDPGWNIAYWNLPERVVSNAGDALVADGVPARFFHFSGFGAGGSGRLSRYSDHVTLADAGGAARVFEQYERLLAEADHDDTRWWPYAFDAFDNGVRIPSIVRRIYAELRDDVEQFGDPFRTGRRNSFFRWLRRPARATASPGIGISRFWELIHQRRVDLQRAFPDIHGADRAAFQDWTRTFGRAEYGLPDAFVS
jgi:hypothetical protein